MRLLAFYPDGQLVDEQMLYESAVFTDESYFATFPELLPRSVSSTMDEQGHRILGLATRDRGYRHGRQTAYRSGFVMTCSTLIPHPHLPTVSDLPGKYPSGSPVGALAACW